jgi:hypothetical protein
LAIQRAQQRTELEDLFTVQEVATKARLSPKTIKREINRPGGLTATRLGTGKRKIVRIAASEYDKWWKRYTRSES